MTLVFQVTQHALDIAVEMGYSEEDREALEIAAKTMGISRYTVYNYIREAKLKGREV